MVGLVLELDWNYKEGAERRLRIMGLYHGSGRDYEEGAELWLGI